MDEVSSYTPNTLAAQKKEETVTRLKASLCGELVNRSKRKATCVYYKIDHLTLNQAMEEVESPSFFNLIPDSENLF